MHIFPSAEASIASDITVYHFRHVPVLLLRRHWGCWFYRRYSADARNDQKLLGLVSLSSMRVRNRSLSIDGHGCYGRSVMEAVRQLPFHKRLLSSHDDEYSEGGSERMAYLQWDVPCCYRRVPYLDFAWVTVRLAALGEARRLLVTCFFLRIFTQHKRWG